MLYGKLIFIKKTGGDGSKFPVTEKKITIGRSEECLIRIHNPQVAPQHCQLLIDDNGQVKLKNLSSHTFLNGKPINVGEFILHQGDVFKIGGRMARWEYNRTSEFYKKELPSPGRLVAVVKPQRRSVDASVQRELLMTSAGLKRRYSERTISDTGSNNKVLKAHTTSKIHNSVTGVSTLTTTQNSQLPKMLFGGKFKGRKSTSESNDMNVTPPKMRNSVSPSWKVKIATPPSKGKSIKRKSTPIKKILPGNRSDRASRQSGLLKTSVLNAIIEDSPKESVVGRKSQRMELNESQNLNKVTGDLDRSPAIKTPRKRLAESEKKLKISRTSLPAKSPKVSRLSLATKAVGKTPRISLLKSYSKKPMSSPVKSREEKLPLKASAADNNTPKSTPQKEPKTPFLKSSQMSRKSASPSGTPPSKSLNKSNDLILFSTPRPNRTTKIAMPSTVSKKITPKKSPGRPRASVSQGSTPKKSPGKPRGGVFKVSSPVKRNSPVKSSSPKRKSHFSPGRKSLSTSDSLAKKAATKLKTINPRKPDKNKKAALLVLGKATRKQSLPQNVNVLLKKKIVKKAIKQSTATTTAVSKKIKIPKRSQNKKLKKSKSSEKKQESAEGMKDPDVPEVEIAKTSPQKSPSSSRTKIFLEMPKSDKKSTDKLSIDTQQSVSVLSDQFLLSKIPDAYLFGSNRRTSKRLSSKNDTDKPEYMELSPTALGLIPKNIDDIFKTPKEKKKRRSVSLTTPKTTSTVGIIKSASTNKKLSRKSVRFSSNNLSNQSDYSNGFAEQGTPFKFENVQTPNISLDVFVSPLESGRRSATGGESARKQSSVKREKTPNRKGGSNNDASPKSEKVKTKCARRLLQSPDAEGVVESATVSSKRTVENESPVSASKRAKTMSPRRGLEEKNRLTPVLTTPIKGSSEDVKVFGSPRTRTSKENSQLFKNAHVQKSPRNDLSNIEGVGRLFKTPRVQRSPKNDLSNVVGVKRLLKTPKIQKSPKNDLSNVKGVKKLLATPKVQKSPKNDLSDVKGVKKLLATPKVQKSPKNDLSDVKGVKKLLATPKIQKSPKNDLSDVKGVKKLLATPKIQKSPKNDLSDVKGVKKLLATPKVQKEPKNDLSDLKGVKRLLGSPKVQKSPKNNLSDLRGVKQLLGSPRVQKSPRNDLSDVRGVKRLLTSPKVQKEPKNELLDLRGVKKLLSSPKMQKSPTNDLTNVEGVKNLLKTPRVQKGPKNDLTDVTGVKELFESAVKVGRLSDSKRSPRLNLTVKQLLLTNSPTNDGSDATIKSSKNVRGRRTIYTKPPSPKNDLTNVQGVKELFARHKPIGDFNISLTGVAQLFDLPEKQITKKTPEKSRSTRARTLTRARKSEITEDSAPEKAPTRRGRSRTVAEEPQKKAAKTKKDESSDTKESTERRGGAKRKTKQEEAQESKESPAVQRQTTRGRKRVVSESVDTSKEVRSKRVRSNTESQVEASPPKLRKKQVEEDKPTTTRGTRSTKTKSQTKTPKTAKDKTESLKKGNTVGRKKTEKRGKVDESPKKSRSTSRVQTKSAQASPEAKPKRKTEKSRKQTSAKETAGMSLRKTRSAAKN